MELIPAIDILNNIVVKAIVGERKKYKAIQSKILNSCKLEHIVEGLLNEYDFKKIYIADLNAIIGNKNNFKIIESIITKYTHIDFWVDYGIKTYLDFKKFKNLPCSLIIGSETLKDVLELKKIKKKIKKNNIILSLDYKNNRFLGPPSLIKEKKLWPKKIILMALDNIGSRKGPNINKYNKIKSGLKKEFYLAGGIRNNKDIFLLKEKGVNGVILSNALHEKKIIYKNL